VDSPAAGNAHRLQKIDFAITLFLLLLWYMRLGYILLITIAVALVGCSKQQDNNGPQSESTSQLIVGKWFYEADTVTNYTNGVVTSQNNSASQPTDYQQYSTNGICIINHNGKITNYAYTILGNTLTLRIPQQTEQTVTIRYISTTGLYLYSETADTDKMGNIYKTTEAAYLR
jgi:hypothetical protein